MRSVFDRVVSKSFLFLKRHKHIIFSVATAAGATIAVGTSIDATVKAVRAVDAKAEEKGEPLTKVETGLTAAKFYIPTAVALGSTIGLVAVNHQSFSSENAGLVATCCSLSQMARKTAEKTDELYGPDASQKVRASIAAEGMPEEKPKSDVITIYDPQSGTYMVMSELDVQEAFYQLNRKFMTSAYATLNDLYSYLHVPQMDFGGLLGWSYEAGALAYDYDWIDYSLELVHMEGGWDCYYLYFPHPPTADYLDY